MNHTNLHQDQDNMTNFKYNDLSKATLANDERGKKRPFPVNPPNVCNTCGGYRLHKGLGKAAQPCVCFPIIQKLQKEKRTILKDWQGVQSLVKILGCEDSVFVDILGDKMVIRLKEIETSLLKLNND